MIRYQHLFSTLIIATWLIFACAKQMPPPGGPEDKTPPEVVRTIPAPGAVDVATRTRWEIVFSEQMNRKIVADAIFISPLPSEAMAFKWRGKRLKIEFGDTLKENRTYVMTIGAKSSDLRNNQMKDSFSMAFSTGDHIDEGQISGLVYSQSTVEGTLVCAYLLNDSTEIDPTAVLADYYTQCNQQGKYQLMYIAPATYRLFAIRDRDGNRKYTRGVDAIGITNTDVNLTPDEKYIQNINFQLTVEDTLPPAIKTVYAINRTNLIIRFSEELADFDEHKPHNYVKIIPEHEPGNQLPILTSYKNTSDQSSVHLNTLEQSAISYGLFTQNLVDKSGNLIDTLADTAMFMGNIDSDTTKPTIIFKSIPDSSKGMPLDQKIQFIFSEALIGDSFERNFRLKENDSLNISGSFEWRNPADVSFQPNSAFKSLTWYTIQLGIDSIKDLSGNSLADSVNMIHFKTLHQDTLSAIAGELVDEDKKGHGKLYLTAKSEKNAYHLVLDEPGGYRFDHILPGIYLINGFRDADSNDVYSFGRAFPFKLAERFFFYPDSIKVRSRWPNEGNDIAFK